VYAVGYPGQSHEQWWMAAVLAFPDGAALSHRSAASLWQLLPPQPGPVDVSLNTRGGRRSREGIRLHRCSTLGPTNLTRYRGIPVTNPRRTISDLRPIVSPEELRRAIRQAEMLGLPVGVDIDRDRTRSELEHRFLRLCRRHHLPIPEINARIGSLTVDFLWRERRLVVETDGYRYHRGRVAFEDDRARDLVLREQGFEVIRLTYRQLTEEPERVAEVLTRLLTPSRPLPSSGEVIEDHEDREADRSPHHQVEYGVDP
jgi:very-short-patch-repair endonuclease